jgi:hypothetical protein
VSGDLFAYPSGPLLYADDPNSNGAAVEAACIEMGLFDGKVVHRENFKGEAGLTNRAQTIAFRRCGRCPQLDTLGRELRHREGTRQHYYDRLIDKGWRIVCQDGRVWAEAVTMQPTVAQYATPGHGCAKED